MHDRLLFDCAWVGQESPYRRARPIVCLPPKRRTQLGMSQGHDRLPVPRSVVYCPWTAWRWFPGLCKTAKWAERVSETAEMGILAGKDEH